MSLWVVFLCWGAQGKCTGSCKWKMCSKLGEGIFFKVVYVWKDMHAHWGDYSESLGYACPASTIPSHCHTAVFQWPQSTWFRPCDWPYFLFPGSAVSTWSRSGLLIRCYPSDHRHQVWKHDPMHSMRCNPRIYTKTMGKRNIFYV